MTWQLYKKKWRTRDLGNNVIKQKKYYSPYRI